GAGELRRFDHLEQVVESLSPLFGELSVLLRVPVSHNLYCTCIYGVTVNCAEPPLCPAMEYGLTTRPGAQEVRWRRTPNSHRLRDARSPRRSAPSCSRPFARASCSP